MAYGFRPNPPGYVSFDELREGFVRWLRAGGDQDAVTITRDGRGAHSVDWLLAVLSHSDEVLNKREQMIFGRWLWESEPRVRSWERHRPETPSLTFREAAQFAWRRWRERSGGREADTAR